MIRFRAALLFAALLLLPAGADSGLRAQGTTPPRELSQRVVEQLGALRTLTDGRDYDGALALIARLVDGPPRPNAYDRIVLLQLRAQVQLALNDYAAALTTLEALLRHDQSTGLLEPAARAEVRHHLARLHYQRASGLEGVAARRRALRAALDHGRAWLELLSAPTAAQWQFQATVMHALATVEPARPNRAMLEEARALVARALGLDLDPAESLRVLDIVLWQALDEREAVADRLEVLVRLHPDNEGYWRQLVAAQLRLAAEPGDAPPSVVQARRTRALLAMERARERGFMGESRDRLNEVGLWLELDETGRARALLREGLESGRIEDERRHWELLAHLAQRSGKLDEARESLQAGLARHRDDPRLAVAMAQLWQVEGKAVEAVPWLERALGAPEGLERPGAVAIYLAQLLLELERVEDAERWLEFAAGQADASAADVERLRRAIKEGVGR